VEHRRGFGDYPVPVGVIQMNARIFAILAAASMLSAAGGPAVAMPLARPAQDGATRAIPAQYYYDDDYYMPRRRPRITVHPNVYFDDYSNFYPARRGFGDRNPVPRGNMRGCTVDLGYGRYESCDK
jgi:hypothetical protein